MSSHNIISMSDGQLDDFTTSDKSWNIFSWISHTTRSGLSFIQEILNSRGKIKELISHNKVLLDQIKMLQHTRDILEEENRQISLRLSATIACNLRDNNPNIVDLNDQYRPTKLSEMFNELYDNQWTSAFCILQQQQLSDIDSIEFLHYIVMKAYSFAEKKVTKSWKGVQVWFLRNMNFLGAKETRKWLKDSQKATILEMLPKLHKDFISSQIDREQLGQVTSNVDIDLYIRECLRVSLLMVTSDPPVVLVSPNCCLLQNKIEDVIIADNIVIASNDNLDMEAKQIESMGYGNSIDSNEKHVNLRKQENQYTDKEIIQQTEKAEDNVSCENMEDTKNGAANKKCKTDEDENSVDNFYDCQEQETESKHQAYLKKDIQGYLFNRSYFKEYTKSGKYIDFIVWPMMFLCEGGPLLAKGVVQCRK